jgi:hypothetical protein
MHALTTNGTAKRAAKKGRELIHGLYAYRSARAWRGRTDRCKWCPCSVSARVCGSVREGAITCSSCAHPQGAHQIPRLKRSSLLGQQRGSHITGRGPRHHSHDVEQHDRSACACLHGWLLDSHCCNLARRSAPGPSPPTRRHRSSRCFAVRCQSEQSSPGTEHDFHPRLHGCNAHRFWYSWGH